MNAAASEPAAEASPWRVFQMNDYEWWMGRSLDEVCRCYVEAQACSEDDCKQYGLFDRAEVRELTDAELDRLQYINRFADRGDPNRKRTFRAELERRLKVDRPEYPAFFATSEI
jgi:hypothetical protein